MYGGYCFFNNAAIAAEAIAARDRRAGRDPRRRLPPRQRHPADLLAARRRPLRLDPRRPRPPVPVLPRPRRRDRGGRGRAARTSTSRSRPGTDDAAYLDGARPGARGDRGGAGLGRSSCRSGSTRTALDPIGDFALTTAVYHEVGPPGRRARPAAGHPPGGRLPPAVARRERAGLAARRRGPRSIRCRHRVHRGGSVTDRPAYIGDHARPSSPCQPRPADRRRDRDRDRRGPAALARD